MTSIIPPTSAHSLLSSIILSSCLAILTLCASNAAADATPTSRTLTRNQTVSIRAASCDLQVRSFSGRKAVVRCKSNIGQRGTGLPLRRNYLAAKQSATIKGRKCELRLLKSSKSLVTVECRQAELIFLTASTISLPTSGAAVIQLINTSSDLTARNVHLKLPAGWSDVNFATTCATLAPSSVCNIVITTGTTLHSEARLLIQGTNTNTLTSLLTVTDVT